MDKVYFGVFATSIGVLLGFSLTLLKEMWIQKSKTKKEIYYLSIHIVSMLDRFMENCIELIQDEGEYDQYECLVPQVLYPKFEPLSVDVEWKAIPNDLMYNILNFPKKIVLANRVISDVYEYDAVPPHYKAMFEERKFQYALLGLEAFDLASLLREKSNLPPYETNDWNPKEYMLSLKLKLEVSRKDKIL